jgi:hypothetical protein
MNMLTRLARRCGFLCVMLLLGALLVVFMAGPLLGL